mmetsp:Transcript_92192/g.286937  ORF Transcript_92192/g.286937 Transcript_92192/m.286937 type:complete len:260 (+) Transcript_92192:2-781(+)
MARNNQYLAPSCSLDSALATRLRRTPALFSAARWLGPLQGSGCCCHPRRAPNTPPANSPISMPPATAMPMPSMSARGPSIGRGRGGNLRRKVRPSVGFVFGMMSSSKKGRLNWKACDDVSCACCEKPRLRISMLRCCISSVYVRQGLERSTSQNAVVMAPPAAPYAVLASEEVSSSSQPENICTSPRLWYGFVSSFQPRPVHMNGRSRPVPLWQQSMTAVSRTPSGKCLTASSAISSSVSWPADLKSTGRMVSFMPSSS